MGAWRFAPRDRARESRSGRGSAAAVHRHTRRPSARCGERAGGAPAVRADRSDPAAPRRERGQDRSRDRALRHRPRHPPFARTRSGARRLSRSSFDRGRRRPCLGARAQRPLCRSAAVLEARAPARDARCAQVLPPRNDRTLSRPWCGGEELVPACARAQPALLGAVGTGGSEIRVVKRFVILLVALAALAAPVAAAAHPLGNFTVNRFSRLEVSGPRVYVFYVLDLAEIPTFQAGKIDARAYSRRIARGVTLTVDGRPARLVPVQSALAHPRGAGGLRTTRLEIVLRGRRLTGASEVRYVDTNYAERIGWKEIVVGGDVPSRSHELRAYPKDLLQSPLDVTTVSTRLVPGTGAETAPVLTSGRALQAPDRVADSGFASLVSRGHLGLWVILGSLAAAMFWGAAHALSPGHGKTIVAAYLVGQRGTPRHAALLGLIVTVTHTIGVFALGLVTLLLSRFIVPDELYPWLNLVSGMLVVGIGGSVLRTRWKHRAHAHAHTDGHEHHHDHEQDLSRRSLVAVLAAVSLHRVGFGMLLVVAFSVGLALTITGIGLVAVLARGAFRRFSFEGRLVSLLPAASALGILAAGVGMTVRALPKVT